MARASHRWRYLTDAYCTRFRTAVHRADGGDVYLEDTAFYPIGGGQPSDVGHLTLPGGERVEVSDVRKTPEGIAHTVIGTLPSVGTIVDGEVDWHTRYAHMRYHTALHILSGAVYRRFGSGVTGGQIYADRARMDFGLTDFSPAVAQELLDATNEVVRENRPIRIRFLTRPEVDQDPSLVRVARELLPDLDEIRLIDIEGFDVQADGGTHVRATGEVGKVTLQGIENKGSKNKRLSLTVPPILS